MKNDLPCPTIMRLLINYDPKSGLMTWKKRPAWTSKASKNNHNPKDVTERFNNRYAGSPALSAPKGNGYLYGNFRGKNILAHRAAWCMVHGSWPEQQIDHINGNRSDNRIENLRDVSALTNSRNRCHLPANFYYGLTRNRKSVKWTVRIKDNNKNLYLGSFEKIEDAIQCRVAAEKRIWGDDR
jgi:hypothetical protein